MYHYVYRLDHLETTEFYIGSRSSKVHPSLDSYMGSMTVWKPNKIKLRKTILRDDFVNRDDAMQFEADTIRQFINDDLNRNYYIPGKGFHTTGSVTVRDSTNLYYKVNINDPLYLSGELVHISKGYTTVIDECGNTFNVSVNDPNFLSKKFKGIRSGYVPVKDSNGNTFSVSKNDPRYLSGEYVYIMTGMITVRDINGHTFNISNNDPRYLSGELVPTWTGRHHTEKSINQLKETYKRIGHQQGEKNSQFGTCWINNGIDNKKIKKEELEKYLNNNWLTGRSSKKHI